MGGLPRLLWVPARETGRPFQQELARIGDEGDRLTSNWSARIGACIRLVQIRYYEENKQGEVGGHDRKRLPLLAVLDKTCSGDNMSA